jgi:hypothetical protein
VSSADVNGLRGPSVERSRVMRGALAHHHLKVWLSIRLLILPIRLVDRLFGLVADTLNMPSGSGASQSSANRSRLVEQA